MKPGSAAARCLLTVLLVSVHAAFGYNYTETDSPELLGDLVGLHDSSLSLVGGLVKAILLDEVSAVADEDEYYIKVPALYSSACRRHHCCVWSYIAREMERTFRQPSGQCSAEARGATRLAFHDAAGWSKNTGDNGGADGSIVLSKEEKGRPLNVRLVRVIDQTRSWHRRWAIFGVSMADFIQMGATVATVVCPRGPRIRSFVGRRDNHNPCPDGLLPDPLAPPDQLIELFRAKTISPTGLATLIGAHTTSRQRFFDPSRANAPQDSTPGIFDILYYREHLGLEKPSPEVLQFPADRAFSKHPLLSPTFRHFADKTDGQKDWNHDYAREFVRLSLLGVNNINNLTDCTRVLPRSTEKWGREVGGVAGIGGSQPGGRGGDMLRRGRPLGN